LHKKGELESRLFTPSTVNRLDRNTSGIVIIGKDADTIRELNEQIKRREIGKWYLTIVHGSIKEDGDIDRPLIREQKKNKTRVIDRPISALPDHDIKSAHTQYRVLAANRQASLVEVKLISGRTHQIRAHMKSIGHPLIGDIKYGGRPFGNLRHQLLHAYKVQLADGREFLAPLPNDFQSVLAKIGLSWELF
jgi:RluA family pseudouridine synthase